MSLTSSTTVPVTPSASAMPRWNAAFVQSNNIRERSYSESTTSAHSMTANLFSDLQLVPRYVYDDDVLSTEQTSRNVPDIVHGKLRSSSLVNDNLMTVVSDNCVDDFVSTQTSTGSAETASSNRQIDNQTNANEDSSAIAGRTSSAVSSSSSSMKQTQSPDCQETLTNAYRSMLVAVGEDPEREGLVKTPERAALAMMYFTKGYKESVAGKYTFITFSA